MKKNYLISLTIIVIVVIIGLVLIINNNQTSSKITLLVVPNNADITINGNQYSDGQIKLKPGNYILKASLSGFSSQQENFTVKQNQKLLVGFVLSPNSQSTANYYATHPNQELLSEALADNLNNQYSNQTITKEPIVKFLPHNGPDYIYSINYAVNPNSPTEPIIQITANNPLSIDAALNWIKTMGYNPANLNLQFINQAPQIKL